MEQKNLKLCKTCGESKEEDLMAAKRKGSQGQQLYKNICKKCDNIRCRERRKGTQKEKDRQTEYYWRNKEKFIKYSRDSRLRRLYNMTEKDYQEMKSLQNNKCKICSNEKVLVIDHCHTTGRVRGLLCDDCNKGIGCLKDNKEILLAAIQYIGEN